eukprot:gene2483-2985_t
MTKSDTGVLILDIAPLVPAAALVRKGDVLLSVDGLRIANDGTIPFSESNFKERVQLSYYFSMRFPGDGVALEVELSRRLSSILREGVRETVVVPLCVPKKLIPRTLLQKNVVDRSRSIGTGTGGSIVGQSGFLQQSDEIDNTLHALLPSRGNPSYLIVGGLVLLSLSREYLDEEMDPEAMAHLDGWSEQFRVLALVGDTQSVAGEEAVILSQVIVNECNVGYETLRNLLLKSFNGHRVLHLRQLKRLVDEAMARVSTSSEKIPMVFEFSSGNLVVVDGLAALRSQEQVGPITNAIYLLTCLSLFHQQ